MASVYLQMGHCFRTSGSTGTSGEQAFNKAVAVRAARLLRDRGHKVFVREADVGNFKTDVFAAFHADGSLSSDAQGASVGHQDADGRRFGGAWKRAYQRLGWEGGFRFDNHTEALAEYYGVRDALAAGTRFALAIEAGFLTSPIDGAELRSERGKTRVAQALTRAVGHMVGHPREA
jgi:N-acetylmuramoyl-L-alanine amidase